MKLELLLRDIPYEVIQHGDVDDVADEAPVADSAEDDAEAGDEDEDRKPAGDA